MFDRDDFSHLDDPNPHSLGTEPQLAAARNRGRAIARHRRRNRLAAGSAAVAATAGVSAVAVVGLPARSDAGTAGSSASTSSSPDPLPSFPATPVPSSPGLQPSGPAPSGPAPSVQTLKRVAVAAVASSDATKAAALTAAPPTAPTSIAATVSPTASPTSIAATVSPTPVLTATAATPDCAAVSGRLHTTPTPYGFTPLVPPSGILSWSHAGAPISAVVVTVSCSPFDPSQLAAGLPVKEVTVLGAHSWLIGDPASGKLQLTWNATEHTSVTVGAQVTLPEKTGQVEDQLLTLGNMLVD